MTSGTDRTTKILLGLIAAGLWVNVADRLFTPGPVSAQDFSDIERTLRSIRTQVNSIQVQVNGIAIGACPNKKIC